MQIPNPVYDFAELLGDTAIRMPGAKSNNKNLLVLL